jgi:hypothetical protein
MAKKNGLHEMIKYFSYKKKQWRPPSKKKKKEKT